MAVNIDHTYENTLGKSYLSFKLDTELFAIDVMKVMEILEVPRITKVPKAPNYLVGVINLRGAVLPVIDTRIKFGMEPTDYTVNTCVVVLNVGIGADSVVVGALVDSVSEVFEVEDGQVQPSPSIGAKYQADFIHGMIKEKDQFMMLLNIDKVFSALDMDSLREANEEVAALQQ